MRCLPECQVTGWLSCLHLKLSICSRNVTNHSWEREGVFLGSGLEWCKHTHPGKVHPTFPSPTSWDVPPPPHSPIMACTLVASATEMLPNGHFPFSLLSCKSCSRTGMAAAVEAPEGRHSDMSLMATVWFMWERLWWGRHSKQNEALLIHKFWSWLRSTAYTSWHHFGFEPLCFLDCLKWYQL